MLVAGQESYVSSKLQQQDVSFFPLNKSMDLQSVVEQEETIANPTLYLPPQLSLLTKDKEQGLVHSNSMKNMDKTMSMGAPRESYMGIPRTTTFHTEYIKLLGVSPPRTRRSPAPSVGGGRRFGSHTPLPRPAPPPPLRDGTGSVSGWTTWDRSVAGLCRDTEGGSAVA